MNPFDRIQCEDLPPVPDDEEFDDLDVVLDDNEEDLEEEDEVDEN